MIRLSVLLMVLLAPGVASAQSAYWQHRPPRQGDVAPPYQFSAVLTPGAGGSSDAGAFSSARLKGRAVVLDFFATWCAPCIAAIPHIDKLVAETRDLPVTYIAVGQESADLLRRTLAKHPMTVPFLHDADGSVSNAYWVSALPHVVVIDRNGRILTITHPNKLTRDVIRQAVSATAPGPEAPQASPSGAQKPAVSLTVHATENRSGSVRQHQTTGEFLASGVGVQQLLRTAWGTGIHAVDLRVNLPDTAYDVHIVPPVGSPATALQMLRVALEGLLGIEGRVETREADGYRLSRPANAPALERGAGTGRRINRDSTRLDFTDVPIDEIARTIGMALGKPVKNDTGLSGTFSLDLRWTAGDSRGVIGALEKAGFIVQPESVPVQVLVVQKRGV